MYEGGADAVVLMVSAGDDRAAVGYSICPRTGAWTARDALGGNSCTTVQEVSGSHLRRLGARLQVDAHLACEQSLGRSSFAWLHRRPAYRDIAERAIRIESRTNWRYAGLAADMFSADGVAEVSFIDAFFTNGTFIPQALSSPTAIPEAKYHSHRSGSTDCFDRGRAHPDLGTISLYGHAPRQRFIILLRISSPQAYTVAAA